MPEGEMGFIPPGEIDGKNIDNESLAVGIASEIGEAITGESGNSPENYTDQPKEEK